MGIALGLGAALSWGAADYFVALASRRVGALRVALGFHLAALVPLAVLAVATNALAAVSPGEVLGFAALGLLGWLSYLAFYRALAIGPISVLSPVVSGYAAVTVILAIAIVGEQVPFGALVAVLVTLGGVTIVSADMSLIAKAAVDWRTLQGLACAIAAMVLFGAFLFGVSFRHAHIGWLAPIFLARGFTAAFLLLHGLQRDGLAGFNASRAVLGLIGLIALLDTGGYVFFNVGVRHASTAVVATASAPYALVPVLAGVCLLSERLSRTQWLGVATVCGGLVLLGAAS
jgi:drug/metabolite transporter (DMT)-like permease